MDGNLHSLLELNQSSLQDYLECPRRFELHVLRETLWPAAHSAPLARFEELTEIGTRFHHLCHQFFLGIDPELLSSSISNPEIIDLWNSFLPYGNKLKPYKYYYEQILRIPFKNHFLLAKFDLIVQESEDHFLIIDWKTAKHKPSKTTLANRVQTFLYPYIFQQAGSELFDCVDPSPSSIVMQYWYPLSSEPEEIFPYSDAWHSEVANNLGELISSIEDRIASDKTFPLTEDIEQCKYCIYRSYCERGYHTSPTHPGDEIENEDLSNVHFDWDLIKEIEY